MLLNLKNYLQYTVSFSSVKIFIFAVIPFDASHPFSHFEFKDRDSFFSQHKKQEVEFEKRGNYIHVWKKVCNCEQRKVIVSGTFLQSLYNTMYPNKEIGPQLIFAHFFQLNITS